MSNSLNGLFCALAALVLMPCLGAAPAESNATTNVSESQSEKVATRPPLGLEDLRDRLERARDSALRARGAAADANDSELNWMEGLELSIRYLDVLATASLARIHYDWTPIGKQRVSQRSIDTDVFEPNNPVRGATAIRFRTSRGNVRVVEMTIRALDRQPQTRKLGFEVVEDLPRRPVVFLGEVFDLRSVELVMRNEASHSRRMYLEAGAPDRPEYARMIGRLARQALALSRRGLFEPAAEKLTEALDLLSAFQSHLRDANLSIQP